MIEATIACAFLLPATLAAGYYFATVGRSLFPAKIKRPKKAETRFAILVPAHNEALSLPATLQSILELKYAPQLARVFVVADNCTDETANVARSLGVTVLERNDANRRGKGYALEYALATILKTGIDAVLILDADGELAPDALQAFDARLTGGCDVVQGSIRTRNAGDGPSGLVAAVGNVLDDAVAAGRDRLGLRVPLRGSNMVFRRDVLERIPWTCHGLTEDAEYGELLKAAGVRVRFEPNAKVKSESPAKLDVLCKQRQRWRAALRTGSWLDSKPLVLGHLLLTAAITILAALMCEEPIRTLLLSWLGILSAMTAFIYIVALGKTLTWKSLPALLGIPGVVVRLAGVTLSRSPAISWERTRRSAES